MERRIGLLMTLSLGAGVALSACGAPQQETSAESAQVREGEWIATPRIHGVAPQATGVLVHGVAAPGARVVLSGVDGTAVAAGADARGRFELQVGAEAIGQVLTPEIQIGQVTTPGPQRLLVAGARERLAVVLTDGGPSLRLTPGPVLDALDGDGRGLIASGRATPGESLIVRGGSVATEAVADERGRWVVALTGRGDEAGDIEAAGRIFHYPGPGLPADRAERAGEGWRITRRLSGAALQTTWLPD